MLRLRPDVRITPLGPEHADQMYRWMLDPVIASSVGLRAAPSAERTMAWIQRSLEDPLTRAYAVLLDEDHVGNVVLDRTDRHLGTSRLSVYIGEPSARRSGVGLTGVYLALAQGFATYYLHKVWLTAHASNPAAIKTYLTLRFKVEGVLRDEAWFEGRRIDAYYMGILRDEFLELSKEIPAW